MCWSTRLLRFFSPPSSPEPSPPVSESRHSRQSVFARMLSAWCRIATRQCSGIYTKSRSEDGSTTLEVIAALAILAVIGAASYSVTVAGLHASEPTRRAASYASRLVQTDDALRRFVGRIRIPYWVRDVTLETGNGVYRLPYYEGTGPLTLEMANGGDALSIASSSEHVTIDGVRLESVKPLPESSQRIRAVMVMYRIAGKEYRTIASFGSIPVMVDD